MARHLLDGGLYFGLGLMADSDRLRDIKEQAKAAANKAWWGPLEATRMMQDAVDAALAVFVQASAKEFRKLATQAMENASNYGDSHSNKILQAFNVFDGEARAYERAAQILEETPND